jgi:predicted transcriptional regulator
VEQVYRRMRELDCAALPVVRQGELVGMVSLANISELVMVRSALEGSPDRAVTG